ncbi:MAG: GNAT family N-acetyltransferase [Defluviitaleaceae bacterium]|nr:GNAT family N-acetyltransferase [Defluviitaleaceae bacterium]MCL2263004.1 GNAT family N-acetyltransferase [Defluviitaleaceae bacterium]
MTFTRTDKLTFNIRGQLSRVFVEGFYDWIKHFCKDKDKLTQAFEHVFTLEYFYVALQGETVAAMAACTQGFSPIKLERREFVKALGFIRGNIAYFMLRRHMVRNSYPFAMSKTTGSVEFVATAPKFRNQGLGYELLSFIMEENPYDAYILEVADTNKNAVRLYEKLGFAEIKRVQAPKRSGVNFFIYMRRA